MFGVVETQLDWTVQLYFNYHIKLMEKIFLETQLINHYLIKNN